jgi:hypothetical protein
MDKHLEAGNKTTLKKAEMPRKPSLDSCSLRMVLSQAEAFGMEMEKNVLRKRSFFIIEHY